MEEHHLPSIDEHRRFQLSSFTNHICHPASAHQSCTPRVACFFYSPLRLVRFETQIFVLDLRVAYFVLNQPGARGLAAQRFGGGKLTAFFPLEIRLSPVETSGQDEQDRRPEHK